MLDGQVFLGRQLLAARSGPAGSAPFRHVKKARPVLPGSCQLRVRLLFRTVTRNVQPCGDRFVLHW
ncbi:hypothetical protein LHGZ1_1065 [Laribacter hongkongensis]|uniref:Uncharacterized protein n=1 Tax=Laribacter hongkongensis TaxID=168471 RepID=A0A248LHN5_9NEIS|nr:hypothetical protein LHGZ1_1065 [Laribacter hongkongensis]